MTIQRIPNEELKPNLKRWRPLLYSQHIKVETGGSQNMKTVNLLMFYSLTPSLLLYSSTIDCRAVAIFSSDIGADHGSFRDQARHCRSLVLLLAGVGFAVVKLGWGLDQE